MERGKVWEKWADQLGINNFYYNQALLPHCSARIRMEGSVASMERANPPVGNERMKVKPRA